MQRSYGKFALIALLVFVGAAIVAGPGLIEKLATLVGREPVGSVSYELADAPAAATAADRVALWLRAHSAGLIRTEAHVRVDRRAIAAAIAYEALADPRTGSMGFAARFSGPGKVHYREFRMSEGDPSAKQVEDLGLMPKLAPLARRDALEKPDIAIAYIGAIMSAFVRESSKPALLACDDGRLATLYTAWKPNDFAHALPDTVGDNVAGTWAIAHAAYLTDAVGYPAKSVCGGG